MIDAKTTVYRTAHREVDPAPWPKERIWALEFGSLWPDNADRDQRALHTIIRDCLIRALEDPFEWLETSIIVEPELGWGLIFTIKVTDWDWNAYDLRDRAERIYRATDEANQLERTNGATMSDTATPDADIVEITLRVENVTDDPDAYTTDQISKIERESLEYWSKLSEPEQRALSVIARDCLIRLLENPLEWLPTSMVPKSGMRMAMFTFIAVDTLEAEVVKMREEAELELHRQVADLAGLGDRLRARAAAQSSEDDAVPDPTPEAAGPAD